MAKRWAFLWCSIFVVLLAGCNQRFAPQGVPGRVEVNIRLASNPPDCDVDSEDVNLRVSKDKIRWCQEDQTTTTYYIHFEDNLYNNVKNNSPVGATQDAEVNDIAVKPHACSNFLVPVKNKPLMPYLYTIQYYSPTGLTTCNDPKVILK